VEQVVENILTANVIPDPLSVTSETSNQETAIHPFEPENSDELCIAVGDVILIGDKTGDGWAWGNNLTTSTKGYFPLVVLGPKFGGPPALP
jgi:hypothetical protein